MKRSLGAKMGEISSLIYLIFPYYGLYLTWQDDSFLLNLFIVIIFTFAYASLILFHEALSHRINLMLFFIHFLAIIYFVYAYNPTLSLFFFFSAFAIPFLFKRGVKSIEFMLLISSMITCIIITIIQTNHFYVVSIIIYYIVILAILFGNFKIMKERQYRQQIEEKNKYINILIAEQERNRIGQDLHDTLGHVFASLSVKSELAAKLIDKDPIAAKKEILNINEISKDTLEKVRHIIENLKVQTFEEEIQSIEQFLKDANIHFNFENIRGASSLNPTKQTILSMILREAINNVIKHAEASEINGKIESYDNGIKLIISDNGIGLKQPSEVKLKSINDRVALLSGTVNITSKQGTTIDIMIPREGVK